MPFPIQQDRDSPLLLARYYGAAVFATAMIVIGSWFILSNTVTVESPDAIATRLGLVVVEIVNPEPVESLVFIVGVVSGVLIFGFFGWFAGTPRRLGRRKDAALFVCSLLALAGLIYWLANLEPRSLFSEKLNPAFTSIASDPWNFVIVCFAIAAAWLVSIWLGRSGWGVMAVISLALLGLSRFCLLGNGDPIIIGGHYEVFTYPMVQDWLGSGIYAGPNSQKSQYGLFALFLRPIWNFTGGPRPAAVSSVMAVLFLVSTTVQISFVARFSRNVAVGAIFGLLGLVFSLLQWWQFWPYDPYFQFFPLRLVFPGIAMVLLFSPLTRERFQIVSYAALAFGLFWNFESGIVALALYATFTLSMEPLERVTDRLLLVVKHMAMGATGLIGATLVVWSYYLSRFGEGPDLFNLLTSATAFSSGVGAIPMPMFGMWIFHFLIFGAALFFAARGLSTATDRGERFRAAALLALAISGLIWMRYYQGRSHAIQLSFVSSFPFYCLGLLVDRAIGGRRAAGVVSSCLVAAPLLATLAVWLWQDPLPNRSVASVLGRVHADTAWNTAVDHLIEIFNEAKQSESDNLLVVARFGQLINLRLGKPSPVPSAGMCQVWFSSELDAIQSALQKPETRMAIFDTARGCTPKILPSTEALLEKDFDRMVDVDDYLPKGYSARIYLRKPTSDEVKKAPAKGPELAFHKLARQSSTYGEADASRAVDGDTNGEFQHGSVTHTKFDSAPFWEVDLGKTMYVDEIEIWNRTDCCSERLRDVWTFASERPFGDSETPRSLKGRPDMFAYSKKGVGKFYRIEVGRQSRYIRVQLQDPGYLSLGEVRVFGSP